MSISQNRSRVSSPDNRSATSPGVSGVTVARSRSGRFQRWVTKARRTATCSSVGPPSTSIAPSRPAANTSASSVVTGGCSMAVTIRTGEWPSRRTTSAVGRPCEDPVAARPTGAGRGRNEMPRILVTNDDGIDAAGLHVLARRLADIAEVVVAAPDREYSGASAALGTLHLLRPEVRTRRDRRRRRGLVGDGPAGAVRDVRPPRGVRRTVRPRAVRDQPRRQLGSGDLPLRHRRRRAHRPHRRSLRGGREPGGGGLRRRGAGVGRDARRPALGRRRGDRRLSSRRRCSTTCPPTRSWST